MTPEPAPSPAWERAVEVAREYRRDRDGRERPPVTCAHCAQTLPGRVGWARHMRTEHPAIVDAARPRFTA